MSAPPTRSFSYRHSPSPDGFSHEIVFTPARRTPDEEVAAAIRLMRRTNYLAGLVCGRDFVWRNLSVAAFPTDGAAALFLLELP